MSKQQPHTSVELQGFINALKMGSQPFFDLPSSKLNEAVAAGFGKRTYASLLASIAEGRTCPRFNEVAFVARFSKLHNAETAEAVGAILDGVQLDIEIEKKSGQHGRRDDFPDVIYRVTARVQKLGADENSLTHSAKFLLPEFNSSGTEPYRIASASANRVSDSFIVSRTAEPRASLMARMKDGRWDGEFFVYASRHQADDTDCVKSVKASMARAILAASSPRVHCLIFRPDHYGSRAHRIEVSIGQNYRKFLHGVELLFNLPEMPGRRIQMDPGFMGNDVNVGRLVDGKWFGDVYSNGMEEVDNPTLLKDFRADLLAKLHEPFLLSGVDDANL